MPHFNSYICYSCQGNYFSKAYVIIQNSALRQLIRPLPIISLPVCLNHWHQILQQPPAKSVSESERFFFFQVLRRSRRKRQFLFTICCQQISCHYQLTTFAGFRGTSSSILTLYLKHRLFGTPSRVKQEAQRGVIETGQTGDNGQPVKEAEVSTDDQNHLRQKIQGGRKHAGFMGNSHSSHQSP